MKKERQKVRYEFYVFESTASTRINQTLVLDNPISVKFINVSSTINSQVIINNSYYLNPYKFLGNPLGGQYPFELVLNNNLNEFDVTTYAIRSDFLTKLVVVAKYFVD